MNLLLKISLSFTDPIEFDNGFTSRSKPETEFVDFKVGKDLYPDPKDIAFSEFTGPEAKLDDVE